MLLYFFGKFGPVLRRGAAVVFLLAGSGGFAAAQTPSGPGAELFSQKCASCHGDNGQGVPEVYSEQLTGERSVGELAQYIDQFMPEGEPEQVNADEAQQIAAFMFDAFYSPQAQGRLHPPHVPLSRLTNLQFKSAVADLFGDFFPQALLDHERGLTASFYNREMRRRKRGEMILERVDPNIDFDYADQSPDPERLGPKEFTAIWEGGVIIPETGSYEFILECKNGARLWVNDLEIPLIDASVRSGDVTVEKASIYLLGGRVYPIRAQLWKSSEAKEKVAGIRVKWKRPHRVEAVIPQQAFTPHPQRAIPVLSTSFPPDDRSTGFERATSISTDWDDAVTQGAIEAAEWGAVHRKELANLGDDVSTHAAALERFALQFAERAFRRPLVEGERLAIQKLANSAADDETVMKRIVLATLKSPAFLYRELPQSEHDSFDAYDTAAWLAFALWDSLPDQALRDAANEGKLATAEEIHAQTARMVNDLRCRTKFRGVLHDWLKLDRMEDLSKDATLYPGFDEHIASDLRDSLDLTLDVIVWSGNSDFRKLFTSSEIFLSRRLADYYQVPLSHELTQSRTGFVAAPFEGERRAGVLTHPLLMSGFAYHAASSPIHRGVFLTRNVLGRVMRPPNIAIAPDAPHQHPGLTTRERVALQTSPEMCQGCHITINSLGFSLEHFDATGRYREEESGKPINATGSYRTRSGELREFSGGRQLADFLAESEEVRQSFVKRVFQSLVKHPVEAFPLELSTKLNARFVEQGYNVKSLIAHCAEESALAMQQMGRAPRAGLPVVEQSAQTGPAPVAAP